MVDLTAVMNEIKLEASVNDCYDETIRQNFRDYDVVVSDPFLKEVNRIYKTHLSEHSKTDKFLSTFYGSVVLFASNFVPNLSVEHATIVTTKLAEKILYFEKKPAATVNNAPDGITSFEIHSLEYLSGYVVKQILKQLIRRNPKTKRVKGMISILNICRTDDVNDQELVALLDRGGLTGAKRPLIAIFKLCEFQFRIETNGFVSKIPIQVIADKLLIDRKIQELFFQLADTVNTIDDEAKLDLLEKMILLYLRVRAFTLSRDKLSAYKEKRASKHGLRKGLKKNEQQKDKKSSK